MSDDRKLEIKFHGRVIEHLGIDMYQSPVAAIAELIANAWDADAKRVNVVLPDIIDDKAEIKITDDGQGMTFEECQERFLNVGYNRRKGNSTRKTPGGRPLMGRKGIGKFAGFGIASDIEIDTTSKATGERTCFHLDANKLLSDEHYVDTKPLEVKVLKYEGPSSERRNDHGTTLRLRKLNMKRTPNPASFGASMARRFLLLERSDQFGILVNGEALPTESDEGIEFDFPRDLPDDDLDRAVTLDGEWGVETLGSNIIKWRIVFYKSPIGDEEMAGVSIFSHHKLAQRPFMFQLAGGYGGQQGAAYLSGQVQADFIDEQQSDLISTERQRVNWEADEVQDLLVWGQGRVQKLLRIWQRERARKKVDAMEKRLAPFSVRLYKLESFEQKILKRALNSIAKITSITDDQFADLADAILTAWEGGRLKDLVHELAEADEMDGDKLLKVLLESRVITYLHAAERVKVQLNLLDGLKQRIERRELENAVRDFIARHPWLVSPEWETYQIERSVSHLVEEATAESEIRDHEDWRGRVDLALSSGNHLLILEFMRPGVIADWDHINRFNRYVSILREKVTANASKFKRVTGLLVADKLERRAGVPGLLRQIRNDDMDAMDWNSLLGKARAQWREYFTILVSRAPDDERMQALANVSVSLDDIPDDGDSTR